MGNVTTLGVASVAAITALCLLVAQGVKATALDNKWLPVICGAVGLILGLVALYIGVPEFPAVDPLTAAAVGTVSGLAATGANQVYKQLTKGE